MKDGGQNAPSDQELVDGCLAGNGPSWEALIKRYRRLIYSIPNKFRFLPADCDDVFQTIVVKLLEHLGELKDESKVSSWLITTTTRYCIQVRSLKQRDVSDAEGLEAAPDPSDTTEEIHIQTDRDQKIRESIMQLPDRCRELLQLLFEDPSNPSYEEISRRMDMPVPSIGPTRARCTEKLQALLRRRGIR
jgi:RNA polymerase sigma factor (sigma-70 family)